MRSLAALAVALLLAGAVAPAVAVPAAGTPDGTAAAAAGPSDGSTVAGSAVPRPPAVAGDGTGGDAADNDTRPDPEEDTLGWEDGRWHDEPLSVDPSDGYDDRELAAVVARTMARVEYVRGLEFDTRVPVEVISRETYRERAASVFLDRSPARNRLRDTVYEALLLIGESDNATRVVGALYGGSVVGYYSYATERIVLVSDAGTPAVDERVLAEELFHALQDARWNTGGYDRSTIDRRNAVAGLVEGDATALQARYDGRCGEEWDCLTSEGGAFGSVATRGAAAATRPPTAADEAPAVAQRRHSGVYYLTIQPYNDGASFVRHLRGRGDNDAVAAAYGHPPASTEQTIHPETYPDDDPTAVTVADRSRDPWRPLTVGGERAGETVGEAGIAVMFVYTAFDDRSGELITAGSFFDFSSGASLDNYNYSHPYSDGWDGDRLVPYVRGDVRTLDPAEDVGYVWKLAWDTQADAATFVDAYERLLSYYGATRVGGSAADEGTVWWIPEGTYADAVRIEHRGTTVVIVNAPAVDALEAVRAPGPSPTPTPPNGTPTEATTPPGTASPTSPPTSADGPGFGAIAALLSVVAAALIAGAVGPRDRC